MSDIDIVVRVCGSAGDGSIAAGTILNRAVALMGYHIMNFDSFPAEIRGFGKSVAHTRISSRRVLTPGERCDCLISLNDPHTIPELTGLREGGIVIYDDKPPDWVDEDRAIAGWIAPGMVGYGVPLRELSAVATRSAKARNIVALGALAGIVRLSRDAFHEAIRLRFGGKTPAMIAGNLEAFDLGYSHGTKVPKADLVDFELKTYPRSEAVEIVSGNEAAARACLDANLRLYAGYPITPATKIMEILAKKLPAHGGVVVQTEDEISAIGHIVGGGFAGKRSATATSGPGLCLMVEFMNLAVMAEVPIVVIDAQRAGPSTGLPTKTEQSDLNLAALGGTGDSPRVVRAPADVAECHELVYKAFEVAEAFQTPVIVLTDFFLANRMEDVPKLGANADRFGKYADLRVAPGTPGWRRYDASTPTGVSPRAVPGMEGFVHPATGLEHDERGFPNYSPAVHQRMTDKRYRKMDALLQAWPAPETVGAEGEVDVGIVSWGSTIGAAREAAGLLEARGLKVASVFPRLLWPFHEASVRALSVRARTHVVAEMNHTGQLATVVEACVHREVLKVAHVSVDPLPAAAIADAVLKAHPGRVP